jgi:hypothetical protein
LTALSITNVTIPVAARSSIAVALCLAVQLLAGSPLAAAEIILFDEPFEDTNWKSRGWYDGPRMVITPNEHVEGSTAACVWHWASKGAIGPAGGSGGARVLFTPVDDVTLSFHIKHSDNWEWTGVPWHPHEFQFVTDVDDIYVGPGLTHLTLYVEAVNGVPRVAIQDGLNIDESQIGEDLVNTTENRSVAGCNGDSDGHGNDDCYSYGDGHLNGKFWAVDETSFGDGEAPLSKSDWHHVRARFRLNTIADGIAVGDGVIQFWLDGRPLIDRHDVVFRTGRHPDMMINQFLMAPYFGPGVPHEQKIWIDDLRILTTVKDPPSDTAVEPESWGGIKDTLTP